MFILLQYEFTIIGPGYYRGVLIKSHVRSDEPNYYTQVVRLSSHQRISANKLVSVSLVSRTIGCFLKVRFCVVLFIVSTQSLVGR